MQPEGVSLIGPGPRGPRVKGTWGEHMDVPAAELEAFPAARQDPALPSRASISRKAACMCPSTEASEENLDTLIVTGWKPVAVPRAKFPEKSQEALVIGRAPGTQLSTSSIDTAGGLHSLDPTPLSGTHGDPHRNTEVRWSWKRVAWWAQQASTEGKIWHRAPLAPHVPEKCPWTLSLLVGDWWHCNLWLGMARCSIIMPDWVVGWAEPEPESLPTRKALQT